MKQRTAWAVSLTGNENVIASWANGLTPGYDPAITLDAARNEYRFISSEFDVACQAEEIQTRAANIMSVLTGTMTALGFYPEVYLGSVIEIFDDGSVSAFVSLSATVQIRSFVSAMVISTGMPQVATPSSAQRWTAAAEADEIVEEMLRAKGRSDSWYDLYSVYECLKKIKARGAPDLTSWWPAADIESSFKDTANFNRHSKGYINYRVPTAIMPHNVAKVYINDWINKAMAMIAP